MNNKIKIGDIVKANNDSEKGYEVVEINDKGMIGVNNDGVVEFINPSELKKINDIFGRLFNYNYIDEAGECFGFSGVTMLRDFGKLRKGQRIESIWFFIEKSTVNVWFDDASKEKCDLEFEFGLGVL